MTVKIYDKKVKSGENVYLKLDTDYFGDVVLLAVGPEGEKLDFGHILRITSEGILLYEGFNVEGIKSTKKSYVKVTKE